MRWCVVDVIVSTSSSLLRACPGWRWLRWGGRGSGEGIIGGRVEKEEDGVARGKEEGSVRGGLNSGAFRVDLRVCPGA